MSFQIGNFTFRLAFSNANHLPLTPTKHVKTIASFEKYFFTHLISRLEEGTLRQFANGYTYA